MKKLIIYIFVLFMLVNNVLGANITNGFDLMQNVFINSTYFGWGTFIGLLLIFITLLSITRNINDWKILFLPVTTCYMIIGIDIFIGIWMMALFIFIIDCFSLRNIGEISTVVKELDGGRQQKITKLKGKRFSFTKSTMKDIIDKSRGKE